VSITTKVRVFLRSVCTTLQDISPQYTRWPEQELVSYANYGQLAMAKYLPQVGARLDAIKLQPGTRQDLALVLAANIIPGDGAAAADTAGIGLIAGPVRNMGANGLVPGRAARLIEARALDAIDPDWHTRTGAAVTEYAFDRQLPKVFWVAPGVPAGGAAVWLQLPWLAEPRRIPEGGEAGAEVYKFDGASAVMLGINDQYVEDLHNYVVAIALMKGSKNMQNLPKAQAHAALFTASINAQAAAATGVNPNLKLLPFAAELGASQ
jgi:hypothetical protein